MMTVKAVVTFENFRADVITPGNFIVPHEYKRSRRMSKEKYIAGVAGSGGAGIGGTGIGSTSGAFETDDDEDEMAEEEDEEAGEISDGEIMRRRACRNGFDDDEVRVRFTVVGDWLLLFLFSVCFVRLSCEEWYKVLDVLVLDYDSIR